MIIAIKGEEDFLREQAIKAETEGKTKRVTEDPKREDFDWLIQSDLFEASQNKVLVIKLNELKTDESLFQSLKALPDESVCMISARTGRSNSVIWKWLKANAKTISAERPKNIESYINTALKNYKVNINKDCERYLKELLSEADLVKVNKSIKMLSFCEEITKEAIDALIKKSGEETAFDIIRHLKNSNKAAALNAIPEKRGEGIAILSALQWSIRIAIKLKLFPASEVGVSSFQENNLKELTSKKMEVLDEAYEELTEAVSFIKKGYPERAVLVRSIARLAEIIN